MSDKKINKSLLLSALTGFFIMGFCDLIPPVTGSIIKNEFPAESLDAVFFLPSMVFIWFFILSTPVAALMNKWGRKAVALIGYSLTALGLIIPFLTPAPCSLTQYYIGFGILGLGNTFVQVAMNPLLATIVPPEKMTSYLTLGQIFRNVAILLVGPLATLFIALCGEWRWLLPVYSLLTLANIVWLSFVRIPELKAEKTVSIKECFRLLKNSKVLLSVIGIGCFIAGDVGVNFVAGQLIDTSSSILTSTGFYVCRIIGTIVGVGVLMRYSDVKYLRWNMSAALLLCLVLLFTRSQVAIYLAMGVMGFAMSCVFATFYAVATKAAPDKANEISGLSIMAISAGAVSCPICGKLISAFGDNSHFGMLFVIVCVLYMLWASFRLNPQKI